MKGVPFFNRRYTKGVPFLSKMVYKRVRVGHRGGASPYKSLFSPPRTCLRIQIKVLLKLALNVVWTAIKVTFDLLQSSGTLMHDKGLLNAVKSALKSFLH